MGKNKDKNKDEIPNPTSVANRDILQRLNFLYQASVLLHGLAPPSSTHDDDDDDDDPPRSSATLNDTDTVTGTEQDGRSRPKKSASKRKKRRRVVSFEELSRSYIETMKSVGQKTMVKMDPSVKRRICKRCNTPLIPGISATVRIQDSTSHGHLVSYRCHCCQTERRIPAPPVLRMESSMNEDTMDVQSAEGSTSTVRATTTSSGPGPQRRNRRGPQPRLLPHFSRDIGHIVFRGNERLDTTHSNS
ncbi:Rpr2-domain-containing protein [Boletus edulis]|nr:Rpr2-domain-containing protein [Boletus edulis]